MCLWSVGQNYLNLDLIVEIVMFLKQPEQSPTKHHLLSSNEYGYKSDLCKLLFKLFNK